MAFDLENPVGTGTDTELLAFWRAHLAMLPLHGQRRVVRGREVELPSAKETLEIIRDIETRINSAAAVAGGAVNYAVRYRAL